MKPIYLDHHATTPLDSRVLEAMMPYLTGRFGNASSAHVFGWEAEEGVNIARRQAAGATGAHEKEIVFTGGATESNNLAIKGVAEMYAGKGRHIITSAAEHSCVLAACRHLENQGFRINYLKPLPDGTVAPESVEQAITPETILISIMLANNETGAVSDAASIGAMARSRGILFHSDCSQAFGKIAVDVNALNLDLASFSAHKFYGPKGVGLLYVRRTGPRVQLVCQNDGGGHEAGMRSGTLNVPGIVGTGKAMQLAVDEFESRFRDVITLRNDLYERLKNGLYVIGLNGPPVEAPDFSAGMSAYEISKKIKRLPDNLNVHFGSIDGGALVSGLRDIAVSAGSACAGASGEPSHVLRSIGLNEALCRCSLRIGVGKDNTTEEIMTAADHIIRVVRDLRMKTAGVAVSENPCGCAFPDSDCLKMDL